MDKPTVSFVIPCYRLAHLLPQCVQSILSQSFRDFEVLILDDCSPDETPSVANSFGDPRVKHVRNPHNLGALRNYNKGISMSLGKYVWLISADDYLRCPDVLEKYVRLMDNHPDVGYCFCPGIGVRDGKETGLWKGSVYGGGNRIVPGQTFLKTLLAGNNIVLAPAAMARRECYDRLSLFPVDLEWAGRPIDLIWGGDWYLWCLFALFFNVGYFSEPMVCYREHQLSMTNTVINEGIENCAAAELAVLWMIKQRADAAGLRVISQYCLDGIAHQYALHCGSKEYQWLDLASRSSLTLEQFDQSLRQSTKNKEERRWIRARVFASVGDAQFYRGQRAAARQSYLRSIWTDPSMTKVYAKLLLLSLGKVGDRLRRRIRTAPDLASESL